MGLFPGLRARGALHPGLTSFAPPGHFGGVADGAEGVSFQNIFVDGAEGVRLKTTGVQRNSLTAECLMNADGAGAGFNSYCGSAAGDFA